MAKFDLGKGLKDLKGLQSKVQDSAMKAVETVADNTKKAAEEIGKNLDKAVIKKTEKKENDPEGDIQVLSTETSIKIIYYLISADGEINDSEMNKFDEICINLDPKFTEYKDALITSCKKELGKVIDDGDYYDVLQDAVDSAIHKSKPRKDSFITPKILLWDLLTIAYSDDNYNADERKLMKHLVRKMNVDKAVFRELESSMLTIMDIEREIKWIKTTDRPYLKIEAMVNELTDRRNVVFEGVKDLISL